MSVPVWYGNNLFFGRVKIGAVGRRPEQTDSPAGFYAWCGLPGGRSVTQKPKDIDAAREMLLHTVSRRVKLMTGADPGEIEAALERGAQMRKAARDVLAAEDAGEDLTATVAALRGAMRAAKKDPAPQFEAGPDYGENPDLIEDLPEDPGEDQGQDPDR